MIPRSASVASNASRPAPRQNNLPYDDAIAREEIQSDHKFTVVLTRGDKFMRRLVHELRGPRVRVGLPGRRAAKKTAPAPSPTTRAKCMGCRYCMVACPFSVPKYEWGKLVPKVRKCTMCPDRVIRGKANGLRGDLSDGRHQVRRARRTHRRSAKTDSRQSRATTSTTSTDWRKWAARRFCCSPAFRSKTLAIAAT